MKNRSDDMVINNPERASWGYRVRDTFMVAATLGLWGMLATKAYRSLTGGGLLAQQADMLAFFQFGLLHFAAVFLIFHAWVHYERLRFRHRARQTAETDSSTGHRRRWEADAGRIGRLDYRPDHQPTHVTRGAAFEEP